MGLLSFLQPKVGAAADAVSADAARLRARRRLIGAAVLVALGVIGLPLLFDTSPRPLAIDIPIETPDQSAGPALHGAKPATEMAAAPPSGNDAAVAGGAAGESREEIAASPSPTTPAALPAPAAAMDQASVAAERVAEKPAAPAEPAPAAKPAPSPAKTDAEAARALAALQDKPAANAKPAKPAAPAEPREAAGRFVVQVGAFSEAASARELRQRVEKLGLKTYTQVADTPAGKRIRVRVGPYSDRGAADRAAARLKQAGLQPAVYPL